MSNSQSQRVHIEQEAAKAGLSNLRVVTADMNAFEPLWMYDRVVSVEMFEHMMNWRELLRRIRSWLTPEGALFLHFFSRRSGCYAFDHSNSEDWIARHFFTGGVMPSHDLIRQYADIFNVVQAWLERPALSAHRAPLARSIRPQSRRDQMCLAGHVLEDTDLWMCRWRWFFLATAGLFG